MKIEANRLWIVTIAVLTCTVLSHPASAANFPSDESISIPPNATANGKMVLPFSCMTNTVFGEDVFVLGNHPDLGNWNPVNARKLHWTDGNVWTGNVAITANNTIDYKFVTRTNTVALYCDENNATWMSGDNLVTNTPPLPGTPYSGKSVQYYSNWTNVLFVYQCGADTNWYTSPMTQAGSGRFGGEYLYTLSGIGKAGEQIEFVLTNDDGAWDKFPDDSNYYTVLDAFLLQDGAIYNYWRPTSMVNSTIQTSSVVSSESPTIPSRGIRIYLPRNYATNTWKDYPVLYMHDGQNDFRPGGGFGCWYAEDAADEMINRGMMRETIIVAVDNTDKRMWEYVPPDGDAGSGAGTANLYMNFLVNDVKTYIDANYRTLSNEQNTATLGSSLGGLVSIYLGLSTNVFGKVGPMSPSYWAATNFVDNIIDGGDSSGLRVYMDAGTDEDSGGDPLMWEYMWAVYNYLQIDGYVENDTLCTRVGCGQIHNEAAWASRVPYAFHFLMDIRDEGNLIANTDNPPEPSGHYAAESVTLQFKALKGVQYILQRSENIVSPTWANISTTMMDQVM